jgi:hypothetical protein
MDPAVFPSVEPLLDKISEIADQQLGEPEIQRVLSEFGKILGKRSTVSINLTVDVFDQEHERSLPLLNTGLVASEGGEPYRTRGDSSPPR